MKFTGAVINEQGVTFAIVLVKKSAMSSNHTAESTVRSYQPFFPNLPIVLASQDAHGRLEYLGRPDLSKFLAAFHPSQIPWKDYT